MSSQRLCLTLLALTVSDPAFAQTATDTFDVTITIADDCEITSTETLDFGTSGVLTAAVDQTATLEVTCTTGTPYDIGFDAGAAVGASTALRGMTSPATDIITYQLFQNAGRTVNWGNTVPTDTVASIGTGSAQALTIYGRVPAQSTPATGVYTDTVTATVTF
ncbi:MAG: spore coat protein [Cypionkella sp.]|uniref:Csu type fimbrial protein n=1 Tax=Cypionkella sp. TaxID=2811411 RepID=UPI0026282611|nr:spore coat U domain-containing protein [Cypionkella sp.]MDB5658751.1 spore coat protein [Cypionkella sp.]